MSVGSCGRRAPLAGSDGIDGFIDVVGGHMDGEVPVVSIVVGSDAFCVSVDNDVHYVP